MGDQTTLDLDDYTQDVEAIARMEYGPKTGQALWDDAEEFYRHNGALLHAHVRAAQVLQDNGIPVSARFLTEFARWSTKLMGLMYELFAIYDGVPVKGDGGLKMPNASSAWLTRYLAARGFDVRKATSKMDRRSNED